MTASTPRPRTLRRLVIAAVVMVLLGGLLMLDLFNQGLAWRAFYNITGEENPIAQLIGVNEWVGRWFRPQPETAPYTPIDHTGEVPFGINVFLEQEVEIEKRERILQMASDAGFVWLRQEFPWEDIEIHGPGDFVDRRNDRNGDGEITEADHVSAWDKYDNIVDLVEQYDMRLMVRLSNPPSWTHASLDAGDKGPPDNLQDYINYTVAVAERYQGRITHYQVWNEPNIFPEWGNRDVSAVDYADMLCQTYDALKVVDEDIVVVSGAIAPTVSMTYRDLNDFIYLQQFFDAGGGDCFDVMSMQGYGLNSGPTDRRLRPTTINFQRVLYIRDLLVQYGYADKPIWISEAAWNPVPPDVPDISLRGAFGVVTEEQAARYMPEAYQRQQEEWPYVGVTFYWFFKRASDAEINQSWYYFRMVEPDFTPMPIYHSMTEYTSNLTPTLYRGVHQADDWAIALQDDAEIVFADGAQFEEAVDTETASFIADGTELAIRWQRGDTIMVYRDGELVDELPGDDAATLVDEDGWHELRVRLSWLAAPHEIQIVATDGTMLLDSVTVYNNTVRDVVILIVGGALVVVLLVGGWWGLRATAPGQER